MRALKATPGRPAVMLGERQYERFADALETDAVVRQDSYRFADRVRHWLHPE